MDIEGQGQQTPTATTGDGVDLFGDTVEVLKPESPRPPRLDAEAKPSDLSALADDLFGDDQPDDAASVATDPLGVDEEPKVTGWEDLTADEIAARRALEYREEDVTYVEVQERIAAVSLEKLPRPQSTNGQYWHVKLPNYLRIDETEFDEMAYEEPDEVDDFPEENIIRWRWSEVNGQQVKESNARIVQWSDGSQALQVGAEFFDINVTASTSARAEPVKPEEPSTASTSDLRPVAGLTLLVAAHPGSYMLEAHSAVNGLMTLVPYSASSTAHRRLANTLSDKHAKVTRTRSVVLEEDPEVQRAKREKAEADKAKAARKERAKASGGGTRRRRGLGRSMAIDRSDDEEDMDEGDSGDERGASTTRTSGRSGRRSYLDGPDEDDEGFVVESEGEDGAQPDVGGADDLDDLDAAAEQAKKRKAAAKAKRPLTGSDRDAEGEMEIDPPEPAAEPAFVRKRLVVGDDDDDD